MQRQAELLDDALHKCALSFLLGWPGVPGDQPAHYEKKAQQGLIDYTLSSFPSPATTIAIATKAQKNSDLL